MQIIIDQQDIEQAIKNFIGTQVTIREGQEVTIDLKAGRGDNGYSATIEIGAPVNKAPTGPVNRTPVASPAKQKVVVAETKPEPVEPSPVSEPATGSAEGQTAQEEAIPAEDATPKTPSIFGGLKPASTRNSG